MQNSCSSPGIYPACPEHLGDPVGRGEAFPEPKPPMHPSKYSPASRPVDPGTVGMMRVLADPANFSCQTLSPLVHYLLGTALAVSPPSPPPLFRIQKRPEIAEALCNVSPLEATLMDLLASVANKRLTAWLNPLDATSTKNIGGEGPHGPPCIHFRVTHIRFLRSADAF